MSSTPNEEQICTPPVCPAHSGIAVGIENILRSLEGMKDDLKDSKDKQWEAINRNTKFMNRMAGAVVILAFIIPSGIAIYEALK